MAISTQVITGTTPTSVGTKSFEFSGFGTPQAILIQVFKGGGSTSNDSAIGYGATDGIKEFAVSTSSEDNLANISVRTSTNITACVSMTTIGATSESVVGVFDSWATNGVTINFTTVDTVAHDMIITLISGCNNAYVGIKALSTTGANDITDPGFKPNLVYFLSSFRPTVGSLTSGTIGFGVAHNNSSNIVSQGCTAWSCLDNHSSDVSWSLTTDDSALVYIWNNARVVSFSAEDFDANGFTLNSGAVDPSGRYVGYLALDTGNTDGVSVDAEALPTSTGNWSTTNPGFTPQHVTLLTTCGTVLNNIYSADPMAYGIGVFSSTAEYAGGADHDYNATITDIQTNFASKALQLYSFSGGHVLLYDATLSSMDETGYTLSFPTYSSGTIRYALSIAIRDLSVDGDVSGGGGGGVRARKSGGKTKGGGGSTGGRGGSSNKGKRGAGDLYGGKWWE